MCGLDSRSSQSSICWNCWKHSFHNSPFHSLTEKYNHLLLYIVLSGRLYRHHGWHITGNTRKAKLTARTFSTVFEKKKQNRKKEILATSNKQILECGLCRYSCQKCLPLFTYLSSNSAKRLSKCRSASLIRSVYKLRSLRAWSRVMFRTSSRLRVRSLARGLMAILSISLFMMMEPAAKHYTERFMS